jgi:threonine/homoserine/homoserine lactone efflux protein
MWKAFIFGLVLAGTVGPIALLIFGTGARQGFAAGTFAGLGAALADLLYALVAFSAGALLLPLLAAHERTVSVACALLLVGLGAWMLARLFLAPGAPRPAGSAARSFLPTFGLTLVNPMTLVVFAGIVPQLPVAGSLATAAGLAVALAAGSAAVGITFGVSGAALGKALPGERARRAISAASAAGIIAFGIYGLAAACQEGTVP